MAEFCDFDPIMTKYDIFRLHERTKNSAALRASKLNLLENRYFPFLFIIFCGTSSLPKPVTLHEILTALLIRRSSLVIISFSLVLSVLYKATKTNTSIDVKLWLGSCNDVVKRCSYREEVKISGGATSPPRKIAKPQSWHQSHTQKHSGWSPR